MSDEEQGPQESLTTEFVTWHGSNGDVHLRTHSHMLFVSKKDTSLVAAAKSLQRGQRITATGRTEFSKTLSTYVFRVTSLNAA